MALIVKKGKRVSGKGIFDELFNREFECPQCDSVTIPEVADLIFGKTITGSPWVKYVCPLCFQQSWSEYYPVIDSTTYVALRRHQDKSLKNLEDSEVTPLKHIWNWITGR